MHVVVGHGGIGILPPSMAKMHSKSGQWSKSEAHKHHDKIWAIAGLFCFGMGVVVMGLIDRMHTWWGVCLSFISLVLIWAIRKPIGLAADKIAKESISYWRGGKTEAYVGWLLMDLPDDWHVFNGIKIRDRQDLDHIVVGPAGLYCISTKSHRGLFTREADGRVFYNNEPTELIGDTLAQMKRLKELLAAELGKDVPWINAILAVPFAYIDFSGKQNHVSVLNDYTLVDWIEKGDSRDKLSKLQIGGVVRVLERLEASRR